VRLKNTITRIRAVFAFGHKNGMTPEVQYGTLFDKPTKAMLRKHRAKGGVKLIEPPDIHKLIGAACPVMKAMILLGLNAGYGNSDIATLPLSAVNLDTGWIDYPRPKNGVARRAKLWSETVEALRAAVQLRPKPKDPADAGLVFLTPRGGKWVGLSKVREKKDGKPQSKGSFYQGISVAFAKLAKAQGVSQPGVNYYTLRRCFRTAADEVCDAVAVDYVMGHADPTMGAVYRQRINDRRLEAVAACVHHWLYGTTETAKGGEG
jgi:integrase